MSVALALMILVGLVVGCGPSGPSAPPSETVRSPSRATRLDALLDRLGTAVRDADRAAFDRQLSRRDPGFGSRAAMIFTNLDRLRPSDFDLRATGQTEPVSDDRAEVLGAGAFAAEVQLSWAMPGDRSPSDQTVWLSVVVEDGQARWAGTADGPDQARPTPLWWLEPVVLGRSDHATVVAGASVDLDRAVATAEDAATEIAARLDFPSGPGADWNGRVVLIMPSNTTLLEQTMGVGRGARSDLAAITWPDGSQLRQAPMRIIVNPSDGSRSELATELVLTHETVHVATRSPVSAAPTWLVEGFADYFAFAAHADAAGPTEALVAEEVADSGPPDNWPSESDFDSSGEQLDLAYAEAWLACRQLADRYGKAALADFYQRVDRGATVDRAARQAFEASEDDLLTQWQRALTRASEDRRR